MEAAAHVPPALLRGPGLFGAIAIADGDARDLRAVARALLHRADPRLVVGVSAHVARDTDAFAVALGDPFADTPFPVSRHGLFVQIAADARDARNELHDEVLDEIARQGCFVVEVSLLAAIEPGARDLFGFVDPFRPRTVARAVVEHGPARACAALVHQAWRQDVARFARLDPRAQTHVMGITKEGARVDDAPPSAHVPRMRAADYALARRGLPDEARTGLHFVAHAASGEPLARALRSIPRADALFEYAYPTTGGAFIAIPHVDALAPRRIPRDGSREARVER